MDLSLSFGLETAALTISHTEEMVDILAEEGDTGGDTGGDTAAGRCAAAASADASAPLVLGLPQSVHAYL